jgi:hypothetical protein
MGRQQSNEIRKELKFQIPNYLEKEILTRLNFAGWTKHYPSRSIHTIYFDNEFDSMLFDSIYGVADRKKIRLRWYNEKENFHLEIKEKKGDISLKKNIELEVSEFTLSKNKLLIDKNIEGLLKLKSLHIKSRVDYNRIYLINRNNDTRITLDKDISTFDYTSKKKRKLTNSFIVELKCNLDFENNLDMVRFQSRFSKYTFSRVGNDMSF